MSSRGRGTLEIRDSRNPFMVTNNQMIGCAMKLKEFDMDTPYRPPPAPNPNAPKFPMGDMSMTFLYSRESSRFGSGVAPTSDSKLAQLYASKPTRSDIARVVGHADEKKLKPQNPEIWQEVSCEAKWDAARKRYEEDALRQISNQTVEVGKDSKNAKEFKVQKLLDSYSHDPLRQNPLYLTTQNEVGLKKPTEATVTSERLAKKQEFSRSFNGIMPRDQGLNTSLTRSNCHKELDPVFV